MALSEAECAGLAERRVNPIRDRSAWGEQIVLGAACTMSSNQAWRPLHARRLADAVERAVVEGTRWVVGRPNDQGVWEALHIQISTFLSRLWRSGLLQGERAEEAYFVRCGRDTMAEDDLAEGRVIVEVGLAITAPGRFVVFRLIQSPGGAQIVELG
jgi:phage tail sheath protein FI